MSFDGLLGNERLKQNLTGAFSKNRISHFYLISGPVGSGKKTLSRLLAAAALCTGERKPCLSCAHCRKAMGNTHPDLITIDDPEKKHVPIDLIRDARADIYIQPNEANRKIYLFPRAQDMRPEAQNALLKILEEPPAYGVFILLTDNAEKLLPTVRSRCTELSLTALPENVLRPALEKACPQATPQQITGAIGRSGGYLGQAMALLEQSEESSESTLQFLKAYAGSDALGLMQVLVPMEKWKRDVLVAELEQWLLSLSNALCARSGVTATQPMADAIGASRSGKDIMNAIDALQKAIDYAQRNISPGAICGYLAWALR